MKFSSTLCNLRKKYIHTNQVEFQHSIYLLIASLREETITYLVTSWVFRISKIADEYFNISETKHVIKKLAIHVMITSEVLIIKPIRIYNAV